MSNNKNKKKSLDLAAADAAVEAAEEAVDEVKEEAKEEAPKAEEKAPEVKEEATKEEAPKAEVESEPTEEEPKKDEAPAVEEKTPEPVKEEVKKEEAVAEVLVAKAEEPNANNTIISKEVLDKALEVKEEAHKTALVLEDIDTNKKYMLYVAASKVKPADEIVAKIKANKKVAEVINVDDIIVDDNNEKVVVFTTDDNKEVTQMQKRLVGLGVRTSIEIKK